MSAIIETKSLTKYYGKHRGIIDLDLEVKEGEIFGVIVPNGAGKSTTLRVLLGLVSPTSGTAEVFGKKVGKQQTEILADIGYLPSEAMFYSGMRVSEVLKLSAKLYKKNCDARRKELCERFALDEKRKISELSLGNRKKVAIVCAFQHDPRLLILDEPTSGLDPLMQKEFFNLVEECHEKGRTVVLSSHVLSEVQQHCNRAAILREGKLIACNSVEKLSGRRCRKVEVKTEDKISGLPGIRKVETGEHQVSFLYEGEMAELLKVLNQIHVQDLIISEPELEEVFLHYYEKGGEQA